MLQYTHIIQMCSSLAGDHTAGLVCARQLVRFPWISADTHSFFDRDSSIDIPSAANLHRRGTMLTCPFLVGCILFLFL